MTHPHDPMQVAAAATVAELIDLAERERRRSIDHFQFTRVVREQLDLGQRTVLAEVMWGVVLADGRRRATSPHPGA